MKYVKSFSERKKALFFVEYVFPNELEIKETCDEIVEHSYLQLRVNHSPCPERSFKLL